MPTWMVKKCINIIVSKLTFIVNLSLPTGKIICQHGVHYHMYANDSQLYVDFDPNKPGEKENALKTLNSCIDDIIMWMGNNQLKINAGKTEFLVAASKHNYLSQLITTSKCISYNWKFDCNAFIYNPQSHNPQHNFLTKSQSPSYQLPDNFIPDIKSVSSIPEDKIWCPIWFKWYMARTKTHKGSVTQLFISTTQPHGAASQDTLPDG